MVDLSELFGEGWCVTLTQLAPAQALERMGVRDVTDVDDGMQLATERLEADGTQPEVLLLGRGLRDGWSLIVELEGTLGWVGMDRAVLEALSAGGRVAASAFEDPNQLMGHVAVDGQGGVRAGCHHRATALHGRRHRTDGRQLAVPGLLPW
ncbi:DUF6461 domain-containing protein [Streptomyces albogriseolus]|uniref:DUF6461 domain-containing protein n=1 Tax=Streptomyces albogriseolus TaxID=1887 RepID=UPI0036822F57